MSGKHLISLMIDNIDENTKKVNESLRTAIASVNPEIALSPDWSRIVKISGKNILQMMPDRTSLSDLMDIGRYKIEQVNRCVNTRLSWEFSWLIPSLKEHSLTYLPDEMIDKIGRNLFESGDYDALSKFIRTHKNAYKVCQHYVKSAIPYVIPRIGHDYKERTSYHLNKIGEFTKVVRHINVDHNYKVTSWDESSDICHNVKSFGVYDWNIIVIQKFNGTTQKITSFKDYQVNIPNNVAYLSDDHFISLTGEIYSIPKYIEYKQPTDAEIRSFYETYTPEGIKFYMTHQMAIFTPKPSYIPRKISQIPLERGESIRCFDSDPSVYDTHWIAVTTANRIFTGSLKHIKEMKIPSTAFIVKGTVSCVGGGQYCVHDDGENIWKLGEPSIIVSITD